MLYVSPAFVLRPHEDIGPLGTNAPAGPRQFCHVGSRWEQAEDQDRVAGGHGATRQPARGQGTAGGSRAGWALGMDELPLRPGLPATSHSIETRDRARAPNGTQRVCEQLPVSQRAKRP